MSEPFIVNACLTGMKARKKHNAAVPMTAEEIRADAAACIEAGAAMVHVHARDDHEEPDWRREPYDAIVGAIREISEDAIVCVSTSGRKVTDFERRAACLEATPRPDMASLTLGSLNFLREGVVNSPEMIRQLAERMTELGIKPELEIFDVGMARTAARLVEEGVVATPCYANILLGNVASADADAADLAAIIRHLPEGTTWSVAGIGSKQMPANVLGLACGHGVRVGLEDNIFFDHDRTPATNPQLVERIVQIGRLMNLRPATPAEVRKRLDLPRAN